MNSSYVMALGFYLSAAAVVAHHGIKEGGNWSSATSVFAVCFLLGSLFGVLGDYTHRSTKP